MNFPLWSTDLAQRRLRRARTSVRPEAPKTAPGALVLAREVAGRRVVQNACLRAQDAGVRPGFSVAQAQALFAEDELTVLAHEPEREERALRAASEWATRFSPIVSPDPPRGLLLDVGGCERLFGSEADLLDQAVDAARRLGLHVRGAIASTAGCAQALALCAQRSRTIVPPGGEREALVPLPVRALRAEEVFVAALEDVGVHTIGQLLKLPRKDLAARFGGDLLLLLDRATGDALEVIDPVRTCEVPRAERAFPGPICKLEMVLSCVRDLLDSLAMELAAREAGVREIVVELVRSDIEPWRTQLALSRPSRDPSHLWKLLEPKLERAHLGYGVEVVAVFAPRIGTLRPHQEMRWVEEDQSADLGRHLAELVDTLAGRLGAERTLRFDAVETHVPEQTLRPRTAVAGEVRRSQHAQPNPSERPPMLFSPPQPAEVEADTSGSPFGLRWQGSAGKLLSVLGPERVALPWWTEEESASRDYFRVQDAGGRWLWLFRTLSTNAWFVHGEW